MVIYHCHTYVSSCHLVADVLVSGVVECVTIKLCAVSSPRHCGGRSVGSGVGEFERDREFAKELKFYCGLSDQ